MAVILEGAIVIANPAYIVVEGGEFEMNDFVQCRRIIDTNGPICAFLAASVLGVELQEDEE